MMAIRPKELPEITSNWAEADWKGHQKSVVTTKSGHTVIVDEPRALGGSDEGPSPMGYLFTSLAGCTTVIIARVPSGGSQAALVTRSGVGSGRAQARPSTTPVWPRARACMCVLE